MFRDGLDGSRQVHGALVDQLIGSARRSAEQVVEAFVGHAQAGGIVEIVEIKPEGPVVLHVDQMIENGVAVFGFAVRCEAHDFVLA